MKNSSIRFCIAAAVCATAVASTRAFGEWKAAPSPLMTEWGEKVTPENAWREYPRPQLVRKNWTCLNGLWEYAVTKDAKGTKGFPEKWDGEVLVPYPVGSALSGVNRLVEPTEMLWYRRSVTVAKRPGERTLLHFGGVDFRTQVFLNGVEVTDVPHEGGQIPFSCDITDFAEDGANELILATWDPTSDFIGSHGKQSFKPGGCFYTRQNGIWQTVWMETVPASHVTGYRTSDIDLEKGAVSLVVDGVETPADRRKCVMGKARVLDGAREVASADFVFGDKVTLRLPSPVKRWSPDSPALYTLRLEYGNDTADGYFAMRTFEKRRDANGVWRFYLNGSPCFLQGPLDQGWWPDGLLTPPSDAAMAFDIQTLKDLGFNMMRKHIKVEPARYYWLCDTMGLMVLQDMPSGSGDQLKRYQFYRDELRQMVDALGVFPSIVMWVPYNESWGQPGGFLTVSTLKWVKRHDPTRLVDAPSGWTDYGDEGSDAIDMHNYRGPGMHVVGKNRVSFLGEFGGLGHAVRGHLWKPDGNGGWGYGGTKDTDTPEGLEKTYLELMERLAGFAMNGLGGSVYTQTTDVEIELNGYMTYDRKVLKFNKDVLRKAHEEVYAAAYEAATVKLAEARTIFPRKGEWAYTTEKPADGWEGASFDDSAWKRGKGGFGHGIDWEPFGVDWNTSDIWLRRTFALDSTEGFAQVVFDTFNDEDIEVYVNGAKVLTVTGYNRGYEPKPVKLAAFRAAAKKGENTIAVHVRQTQGGQYFDAALLVR